MNSFTLFHEFLIQGGIDGEEDARIAAFRELKEETGVTSAEILAEVPYWLTYDFPPEVRAKLNKLWGTDWKGQAQKWFLFRFTGSEDEINLAGDGSEKPEFGEWMWMTPHQVIDHVGKQTYSCSACYIGWPLQVNLNLTLHYAPPEQAVDFKKSVYEEVLKFFKSHLQPESSSEA
ncbi:hypothetical protein ZIOFF_058059 [Zingiber officinale]|uniref:Nudix hydrolase domain-containing protein n=1 Tax=Zingiber officinale TaxID=94328 RepID=A0A8J5KAL3_ZINOF|nr:hypothetical protein ZIOFF_058059 [Zingiber officinale]